MGTKGCYVKNKVFFIFGIWWLIGSYWLAYLHGLFISYWRQFDLAQYTSDVVYHRVGRSNNRNCRHIHIENVYHETSKIMRRDVFNETEMIRGFHLWQIIGIPVFKSRLISTVWRVHRCECVLIDMIHKRSNICQNISYICKLKRCFQLIFKVVIP